MKKRTNYIEWDTYFMSLVQLNAMRSKDPSTQVGAIIINDLKQIIGSGYNGLPRGLDDDLYPWDRDNEEWGKNKYPYIAHAELNAILNTTAPLPDSTLYVTLFPCNECAKLIIQSGIKNVFFGNDKYEGTEENIASKRMLTDAGVKFEQKQNVKIIIEK